MDDRLVLISVARITARHVKELRKKVECSAMHSGSLTLLYFQLKGNEEPHKLQLNHFKVNRYLFQKGVTMPFQFKIFEKSPNHLKVFLNDHYTQLVKALEELEGQQEYVLRISASPDDGETTVIPSNSDAANYLNKKLKSYQKELLLTQKCAFIEKSLSSIGWVGKRLQEDKATLYVKTKREISREDIVAGIPDRFKHQVHITGPDPVYFHAIELG